MSKLYKGQNLIPCEANFELLAKEAPELLIEWFPQLGHADLSFAAEYLGVCNKSPEPELESTIRAALRPLLDHPSPVVREGAIYGIYFVETYETVIRVKEIALSDPNPGVRMAAEDYLMEST